MKLRLDAFGLLQSRIPLHCQAVVDPHQFLIAGFPVLHLGFQQLILPCKSRFGLGAFVHCLGHGGVGFVDGSLCVSQFFFQRFFLGGQFLCPVLKQLLFPLCLLYFHLLFSQLHLHPPQLGAGLRVLGHDVARNHQQQRHDDRHNGHGLFHLSPSVPAAKKRRPSLVG